MARKKLFELLYRTCGHHALVPSALQITTCCDQTSSTVYRGGYADVWKGEHCGQDVAVKVIRTYSDDELQKVINVCRSIFAYYTLLTMLCAEVLRSGCDVELPSTSKYPASNRCLSVRESVRNGIRVDAKREYQQICQSASRSKSFQACTSTVCNLAPFVLTTENSPASRCCQGADLPSQQWNGPWGPQGCEF